MDDENVLKEWRLRKGLTQHQAAEILSWERSTYAGREAGYREIPASEIPKLRRTGLSWARIGAWLERKYGT